MTRLRGRRSERGTLALEMTVLAPILLLLLLFLMACGRFFQTSSLLENAAREGARAATQARSVDSAQTRIDQAVTRTTEQAVESCKTSASGSLTSDTQFTAGEPLTVEVTCTINYRDLGLIGMDKDVKMSRTFTSTLDPYRGVR